jgi:hypothetical protein
MAKKSRSGRGGKEPRMVIPFLSHQVMDYLAALYVLQVGATVGGEAAIPCYVIGGLMLASATFSGKPLGGGRISRRAHRLVDIALILAVAAAPFVFGFSDQKAAVVRLVGLAVALALLAKHTNYARPQPGAAREIARGLKHNAPRLAGRFVARQVTKRRSGPR